MRDARKDRVKIRMRFRRRLQHCEDVRVFIDGKLSANLARVGHRLVTPRRDEATARRRTSMRYAPLAVANRIIKMQQRLIAMQCLSSGTRTRIIKHAVVMVVVADVVEP